MVVSRIFWMFHPEHLGVLIQLDDLRIFFQIGGEKPPARKTWSAFTLPLETNSKFAPEKWPGPNRKRSFSNHPSSWAKLLLVSGRVFVKKMMGLDLHLVAVQVTFYDLGTSWVSFYSLSPFEFSGISHGAHLCTLWTDMEPTKSLTFSRGPKGCQVTLGDMNI